jgi:hypothetical protein
LSAQGICHADVLTTVLFYDKLLTESFMTSMQSIASFLRKLLQIIALSQYLQMQPTEHVGIEWAEYMRDLRLAKDFQILSTYSFMGKFGDF